MNVIDSNAGRGILAENRPPLFPITRPAKIFNFGGICSARLISACGLGLG
jgi:hypothetical protein